MRRTHQSRTAYRSYLLRLWCEEDGQPWRASLQSAATRQTQHFPHVDALFAFLLQQMDSDAAPTAVPAQGSTPDDAHDGYVVNDE